MNTQYPEHEKLTKVSAQSQLCGEFIDWLETEHGLALCKLMEDGNCFFHGNYFFPVMTPTSRLLAEFFGIDERRLEAEKRAMLKHLRDS